MTNQTTLRFDESTTRSGFYKDIRFEIVHWGLVRAQHEALNDGKGCWNYYIYLSEQKISNFKDFWNEPEVCEFSPSGTKYLRYEHNSLLSGIHWHGGITLWEGLNRELVGQRTIKVGCDYSHFWDMQQGFNTTLDDVCADVIRTIDELIPLIQFNPTKP